MLSCCICGAAGMKEEEGGDDDGYYCERASVGKDGGDRGGHDWSEEKDSRLMGWDGRKAILED